jgi:class 3 adenylate cyclase
MSEADSGIAVKTQITPTRGTMAADAELAILFADVVGSSRLFELLGDEGASNMVAACVDLMRRATDDHRGHVVKTMGDEVMSTFERCDDALDAAASMQSGLSDRPDLTIEGQPIMIRIGCHFGPVVIENRCLRCRGAYRQPHDQPGQGWPDHRHRRGGGATG